MPHVLALDQGTTSTRAIVFNHSGTIVQSGQLEHEQIFPKAGWVEHDAAEIWRNTREVVGLALTRANLTYRDIVAVGITNQRETAVLWDRRTLAAPRRAIVWQDRRTTDVCDALRDAGHEPRVAVALRLHDCTIVAPTVTLRLSVVERDGRFELVGFGTNL